MQTTRAVPATRARLAIRGAMGRRSSTIRGFFRIATMPGTRDPRPIAALQVGVLQATVLTGRTSGHSRVALATFQNHPGSPCFRGRLGENRM
jgi:hypothetical protein